VGGDIDVLKAIEALKNMGYKVAAQNDNIFSLDFPSIPDNPYPLIIDASRSRIPEEDLLEQLELVGVDISVFYQHYEAV
jgi:hypothetical protein